MKDSYQKFADDVFGVENNHINSVFKFVKQEDIDEVRVLFAINIAHMTCPDNFRIHPLQQKEAFYSQANKGCCGSWNSQIKCLSGNIYWIGCNYGH